MAIKNINEIVRTFQEYILVISNNDHFKNLLKKFKQRKDYFTEIDKKYFLIEIAKEMSKYTIDSGLKISILIHLQMLFINL